MSTPVNHSAPRTPTWGVPAQQRSAKQTPSLWSVPESAGKSAGPVPLLPLPGLSAVTRRGPSHTGFLYNALWPWPLPVRPTSGLTCVATMPALRQGDSTQPASETSQTSVRRRPWDPLRQFWRTAPNDLRWLAVSLPIILLIVVYSMTRSSAHRSPNAPPPLPQPAVGKSASETVTPPVRTGLWGQLRQAIGARAAVQLLDDFRGGLGAWTGHGNWAHTWSYDDAGFVRTGSLALYRPTLRLTDYHFEFLGQIETRALGWVYRAQDPDNYYASRIVLNRRGGQPTATIIRSAVLHGREVSHVELPLPLIVQLDTVYRVQMDVQGNNFTTIVQGQVVDYWKDDRLPHGGIGFFSNRGEQARLRWVEVTHQADALGRLCAVLVPMESSNTNGSSK